MTLHGRSAFLLVAALLASAALNVFAVSYMAGRWSSPEDTIRASAVAAAYPPAIRSAVAAVLRERREEVLPALAGLRRARLAMFEAARAPQLDEAALAAGMADVRAATGRLQAVVQAALAETLRGTSAEERARIRAMPLGGFLLPDGLPRGAE